MASRAARAKSADDSPYREAMSAEAAVKELEGNSGTQFDPEVVEALLAVLSREQADS